MFARDDPQAVETLYLCVLNRYPSETEKSHFVAQLADAENRESAMEDCKRQGYF